MRTSLLLSILLVSIAMAGEFDSFFQAPPKFARTTGKSLSSMVGQLEPNINNPEFLYNYAWQAYEESDLSTASKYILKAVELRPQNAFLHYCAGVILTSSGDTAQAISHYEKALENAYEYLDAWKDLVEISPEYYYNLAQLFGEKASQNISEPLANKSIEYYEQYLAKRPGGQYTESSKSGIRQMNLLKSEVEGKRRVQNNRAQEQQRLEGEKLVQLREKEDFRTKHQRLVGVYLYTFGPTENYTFELKEGKDCLTKQIKMRQLTSTINEFALGGGYVTGPFFLRGAFCFGKTNLTRDYVVDSILTNPEDSTYREIKNILASVNTTRLFAQADYNFFYANPLMLYATVGGDIGTIYLKEKDPYFESVTIAGMGAGAGAMVKLGSFIIDLSYRYNFMSNSAGSLLTLGGMYKF